MKVVVFVLMLMGLSCAAQVGLIEGFTWTSSDPVNGQYGKYTSAQRDSLIGAMQSPLNSYVFVPHDASLVPTYIWSAAEKIAWKNTISSAAARGITVIMGLRPAYIDNLTTTLNQIKNKINTDFIPAGVSQYVLAWDDTPGAGVTAQMQLQKSLITSLLSSYSSPVLSGIVPAAYYPGADVNPSGGTWQQKLAVLDGVAASVRFYVTGTSVVPSSLSPSNVPALNSTRKFIMWDNWIATDSNTAVSMTFPPSRSSSLYTYGYGLNLAFPPQRIIHQVKALIARASSQPVNVNTISAQWASYLVAQGFVTSANQASASTCLANQINGGVENTFDISNNCPVAASAFTN